MEQTSDLFIAAVHISEGPAAESCYGNNLCGVAVKFLSIFPKKPPDDIAILDVLITGRAYWRTTGEATPLTVRKAKGNVTFLHGVGRRERDTNP